MMRWLLLASWALAAACTVDANYEGAGFQCSESEPCQPGYECVSGTCQLEGAAIDGGGPDAELIDAGPQDCLPPIALSDDFTGPDISTQWDAFVAVGTSAAIVDDQLELKAAIAANSRFATLVSKDSFDFVDHRVFIEVNSLTATSEANFSFLGAGIGADYYFIGQRQDQMVFGLQKGTATTIGSAPYVPADHHFWQLRRQGNEMVAEVSPDGQTWAEIGRTSTANLDGDFQVRISMGTENQVAEAGTMLADNLNLGAGLCE
jgi:hypothetical protein